MIRKQNPSSARSKRCLRGCSKNILQNTKHKTYGKVSDENIDNNSKERTLEDNRWKDSFDYLLDSGRKNVVKKTVRASYNQNSSIDLTVSNDFILNLNSLNKKNKINPNPKSDKRSPFNLDKSLAAINKIKKKILQNPKTKRKIKNKLKDKVCDKLKGKSTASTPLQKKKLQNYLHNCGISPIQPERRIPTIFHTLTTKDHEKLILNYTDSIEEARNLSESIKTKGNSKCNNYSNFRNILDEQEQTKNDDNTRNKESNVINYYQAGLEHDEKMKYVLSYINKIPKDYDKYCVSDVNNINNVLYTSLVGSFMTEPTEKHLEINNSHIDESLLKMCDKICESNPISGYNDNLFQSSPIVKNFQKYNESFRIISLTTISNHDLNNVEKIQNPTINHDITLLTEERSVIDSEMADNENVLDTNKKKSDNEIVLQASNSVQLIEESYSSITLHTHNEKELKNNSNLISKDVGNSNKLDGQIIEINSDFVRSEPNFIISSQLSNKIDSQPTLFQILHEDNNAFSKRLLFLQNCQILNDNIKFSKSINCLDEKKNEEIRRHTIASHKIESKNLKKFMKPMNLNNTTQKSIRQSNNRTKNNLCDSNNINLISSDLQQIQQKLPAINIENKTNDTAKNGNIEYKSSATNHENVIDIIVDKIELRKQYLPNKILDENCNLEMISKKNITRRKPRKITKKQNNNNRYRNSEADSLNNENNESEENGLNDNNNNKSNNEIKTINKITFTSKCKIQNKQNIDKIYNHNENLTSNSFESQLTIINDDCEIIHATPVKRFRRKRKLTNTSTKLVNNNLDKNNILNLSGENIRLTRNKVKKRLDIFELQNNEIKNKNKKHSVEDKQMEVNDETDKKLISPNKMLIETERFENIVINKYEIISSEKKDSDCEIIPGTPLAVLARTRKLPTFSKVVNLTSDTEILDISEKIIKKKLTNDNKILTKQKKISFKEKESNNITDNFKLKKCKIYLRKERPKSITNTKKIDKNINLKKCKILLKRKILSNNSKIIAHSKENIYPPELNISKLTDTLPDTMPNSRKSVAFSNIRPISTVSFIFPLSGKLSSSFVDNSTVNSCINEEKFNPLESERSVIDISYDKDEIKTKNKNFEKPTIKRNIMKRNMEKYNSIIQNSKENVLSPNKDKDIANTTEKLFLTSGKWRRSIINWKKSQSIIELDDSQIPVVKRNNKTISLEKTITANKYKLMPKPSLSHKQTISSGKLVDKELKTQIVPVQKILRNNDRRTCLDSSLIIISEKPEADCKIVEKRQTGVRKTLLLEPTDDGTPNYTTCSLFNTFANSKAATETVFVSNRQKSKRFIEIEEDFNDLQQKDDQQQHQQQQQQPKQYHNRKEFSDERICISSITKNNNKPKFQHQISAPICGTKQQQSSIGSTALQRSTRRGRTIIETSTTSGFEQLSSSPSSAFTGSGDYHHHSNREFIHSLLLNEDEQDILLCPSLNVSIRALLSPRDIVLRRCGQTDPYDFSTIYSEIELRQCRKIGEGVYGEVYMNKNRNGEAIVLKIIPIDGLIEINGEQQKNFEQILPEIIIAAELSRLRTDSNFMTSGFVEVKNVHCVQGRYPQHLIDLWELYRDNCGTENDHPEIFQDDQLYIVLELANGGQDLEAFQFQNALQSYSAFLQTALSLAVAERKFKFEHRDLHWGNILLAPTDEKEINFKFNDKIISIPTHGVKATIIDYTLSRMNFEGCCLYNDLSNDHELFTASGDYQFDIYRLMQKNLENQWERYDPYTNILWLHYTIDKMISGARYRSSKTKKHRSAIQDMMELRDELLDYKSASEYVECLD